MLTKYLELIC